LKQAREILREFYKDHDNEVTYPLTGLLMHLLELDNAVYASSYVKEKVALLEAEVKSNYGDNSQ
jgi:hypothetical protein